jgi:pyrroloquinoline quinone (PQQ) biosynthesis protein C
VALLEKLGSPNSHNCRSDQCVVAARANIYDRPLSVPEQADKDMLDKLARALGFQEATYLVDAPGARPGTNQN